MRGVQEAVQGRQKGRNFVARCTPGEPPDQEQTKLPDSAGIT